MVLLNPFNVVTLSPAGGVVSTLPFPEDILNTISSYASGSPSKQTFRSVTEPIILDYLKALVRSLTISYIVSKKSRRTPPWDDVPSILSVYSVTHVLFITEASS